MSAIIGTIFRGLWRFLSSKLGKQIVSSLVTGVLTAYTIKELAQIFGNIVVPEEVVPLCQNAGGALKTLSDCVNKLPHEAPWTLTLASEIDSPFLRGLTKDQRGTMQSIAEAVKKQQEVFENDHLATQLITAFIKNNLTDCALSVSRAQDALSDLGKVILKNAKENAEKE
jgi:hypothetical protein